MAMVAKDSGGGAGEGSDRVADRFSGARAAGGGCLGAGSGAGLVDGSGGGRLHALDALRAWAMLLGLGLHAAIPYLVSEAEVDGGFWAFNDPDRSVLLTVGVVWVHSFRMHLFFFVAGLFGRMVLEKRGARSLVGSRARRVGLPYLIGLVTLVPAVVVVWTVCRGLALWLVGGADPGGADGGSAGGGGVLVVGRGSVLTQAHLWFLQHLVLMYAVVLGAGWFGRRWDRWVPGRLAARVGRAGERLSAVVVGRWWGVALALPVIAVAGLFTRGWDVQAPAGLVPHAGTLAYYTLFFVLGWLAWPGVGGLRRGAAVWWLWLGLGVVVALPAVLVLSQAVGDGAALRVAFACLTACMFFGVLGLFVRCFGRGRAWSRYVADASYWMYLAHLPLQPLVGVWLVGWGVPGVVKWAVVLVVTTPMLLLSYAVLVRGTWLGWLLHGRRLGRGAGGGVRSAVVAVGDGGGVSGSSGG